MTDDQVILGTKNKKKNRLQKLNIYTIEHKERQNKNKYNYKKNHISIFKFNNNIQNNWF